MGISLAYLQPQVHVAMSILLDVKGGWETLEFGNSSSNRVNLFMRCCNRNFPWSQFAKLKTIQLLMQKCY